MTDSTITIAKAIRKSAIGLAIFAFFTAGIISGTQSLTKKTIANNERNYEARLLLSLLPEGYSAEQLLDTGKTLSSLPLESVELLSVDDSEKFYQAINTDGEIIAVILPLVAPQGYTESIRLIIGIKPNGEVLGVRVTKHKETPGLGDRVETQKSNWIYEFNDKSLANPMPEKWQVKKDGGAFDQLTGATITPRAIVKATFQSLKFFELNKETLLTSINLNAEETI